MFLTGDNAKAPGTYAIQRVKALLETALRSAPYSTIFAPWGRVEIAGNWAEATALLQSTRPFLVLEIGDMREDDDCVMGRGQRRLLIEISIEIVVGPRCAPAEAPLKDALIQVIQNSESALDALALEESEIRAGQGRNEVPGRVNPHTLSLAVHTDSN